MLRVGLLAAAMVHGHAATGPGEPFHEAIIKRYFSGWENKDWDQVASQLAEGFTFTSPSGGSSSGVCRSWRTRAKARATLPDQIEGLGPVPALFSA